MALTEIEAIQAVDEALEGLEPAARSRVLRWASEKYAPEFSLLDGGDQKRPTSKKRRPHRPPRKAQGKSTYAKSRPSLVKDLNLRPKGKKDFAAFVNEKKPSGNDERSTVAVYYLKQELGIPAVGVDHVFTCYKAVNWRQPANLGNSLAITSHRKGWMDTRDFNDLKLTTHGENLVEHDLPRKESDRP